MGHIPGHLGLRAPAHPRPLSCQKGTSICAHRHWHIPWAPERRGHIPLAPYRADRDTALLMWHDSACGFSHGLFAPTQDRSSKQSCFSSHGPDEEESLRAASGLQGSAGPEKVAKGDIKGIKSPSEEPTVESRDKHWPHGGISRGAEAASLSPHLLLLAPPSGSVC